MFDTEKILTPKMQNVKEQLHMPGCLLSDYILQINISVAFYSE